MVLQIIKSLIKLIGLIAVVYILLINIVIYTQEFLKAIILLPVCFIQIEKYIKCFVVEM